MKKEYLNKYWNLSSDIARNKKRSILFIPCIVLIFFFISSCEKMNDLHQPFMDNGEITYAPKVDSVFSSSGNYRIQLEIFVSVQRTEKVRIYWNNYTDSVDIQVGGITGSYKQIIDNLEEKSYIFNVISLDKFGNKSLLVEAEATAYGANYKASLANRTLKVAKINESKLTLNWGPISSADSSRVTYTNSNGQEVSLFVPVSEETTVIQDFSSGLKYETAFSPGEDAIDVFYTETKEVSNVQIDNSTWIIKQFSEESFTSKVTNLIDGNPATRWMTKGGSFPHFVLIDLGIEYNISAFELYRYQTASGGDSKTATKIKYEISADGNVWEEFGPFNFDPFADGGQLSEISTNSKARYVRFTAIEGNDRILVLGALKIYGNYIE